MKSNYKKIYGKYAEVKVDPLPSQEDLDYFYTEQYYSDGCTKTYSTKYEKDELTQKMLRADLIIEVLEQNLSNNDQFSSHLELGSGEGFLLAAAHRRGISMHGVDYQNSPIITFNPQIASQFTSMDPNKFINDKKSSGKLYNSVIMLNVLEHVRDPDHFLHEIGCILSSNGVLIVQVPNDFSAFQAYAKAKGRIEQDYWFSPPQHLNYWNTENICPYMKGQGYDVIDGLMDFPIETYLWGSASNYIYDKHLGRYAHQARVDIDLFFGRKGLLNYVELYRSFYRIGFGRNLIVVLKKIT